MRGSVATEDGGNQTLGDEPIVEDYEDGSSVDQSHGLPKTSDYQENLQNSIENYHEENDSRVYLKQESLESVDDDQAYQQTHGEMQDDGYGNEIDDSNNKSIKEDDDVDDDDDDDDDKGAENDTMVVNDSLEK